MVPVVCWTDRPASAPTAGVLVGTPFGWPEFGLPLRAAARESRSAAKVDSIGFVGQVDPVLGGES